mmetsp:Transcript_88628/g.223188  ORF Transcript_88628/g.223188 Transcript_88628/m.223188 type:complete len:217 (-) Transcript_88628:211-861(-)
MFNSISSRTCPIQLSEEQEDAKGLAAVLDAGSRRSLPTAHEGLVILHLGRRTQRSLLTMSIICQDFLINMIVMLRFPSLRILCHSPLGTMDYRQIAPSMSIACRNGACLSRVRACQQIIVLGRGLWKGSDKLMRASSAPLSWSTSVHERQPRKQSDGLRWNEHHSSCTVREAVAGYDDNPPSLRSQMLKKEKRMSGGGLKSRGKKRMQRTNVSWSA